MAYLILFASFDIHDVVGKLKSLPIHNIQSKFRRNCIILFKCKV